ncbi:TPA: hypothetical protein ACGO1A_001101 [Streptococcus suis]|nr:hypothetical protein [Streptococcus suis]
MARESVEERTLIIRQKERELMEIVDNNQIVTKLRQEAFFI